MSLKEEKHGDEFFEFISSKEASDLMGMKHSTLASWRSRKVFPISYIKIGGQVRYRKSDIIDFIKTRTFTGG